MAINERYAILNGLTPMERDALLHGTVLLGHGAWGILAGQEGKDSGRDGILRGLTGFGRDCILDTKPSLERGFILLAEDPIESLVCYEFKEEEITDFEISPGGLVNEITLNYAYDHAEGQFKASITKHNPLSKLLYGEAKESRDVQMIQGTRQAEKVADAILMTSSSPEIKASFKHDMRSYRVEAGDIAAITHRAGLGANGYEAAAGIVSLKRVQGIEIFYEVIMKPSGSLYLSELVSLTRAAGTGQAGISITYEAGVATFTVYADIQGNPAVQGAEITINGVKKLTDIKGQARFNLLPGTYKAYIRASGYADAEIRFTV